MVNSVVVAVWLWLLDSVLLFLPRKVAVVASVVALWFVFAGVVVTLWLTLWLWFPG